MAGSAQIENVSHRPESHGSSEANAFKQTRDLASHRLHGDAYHGPQSGSGPNSRFELGGKHSTAEAHLPNVSFTDNHKQHALTKADLTVPKDAQNQVTHRLENGTVNSYTAKNGDRVDLYADAKNPNQSYKLENHPDNTWKRINGDGSTVEFNGKETISKNQHKTSVEDAHGNIRTKFDDGKSTDYHPTDDGFRENHKGPNPQDNFNVTHKGDQVVISRTGAHGEVIDKGINLKDSSNNFQQTMYADHTYTKKYKSGASESLDAHGNLTVTDAQHNKVITRANGDVDRENQDGSKYHLQQGLDGNVREYGSGPKPGDNYNSIQYKNGDTYKHTDFGDGHTLSKYTSKDDRKNLTTEKFSDGSTAITDRDGTLKTDKDGAKSYTTTDGKHLKPEEVDVYKANERELLANIHNDGKASSQYEKAVREAVDGLPKDVQRLMSTEGVQIKMSNNMANIWPDSKDDPIPGYPKGSTIANAGTGAYDPKSNEIAMAQRSFSGDPIGTIRHETGHAVDNLADDHGIISDSAKFKAAYNRDVANLTDEQKSHLGYFLKTKNGRSEAFAELSNNRFGGRPDQADYSNRKPLDEYMPETAKLVNKFYDHHLSLDGD